MTPLANRPDYAAAVDDLNRLAAAKAKIESRIAEIDLLLIQPVEQSEGSAVEAALAFSETGVVIQHAADPSNLGHERRLLVEQRSALDVAITKVHATLGEVARRASADVCAAATADHKRLAARALQALLDLDAAQRAELDLIRQIEDAGYSASFLESVRWPYVGMLQQRSESAMWHRVRELSRYTDTPID